MKENLFHNIFWCCILYSAIILIKCSYSKKNEDLLSLDYIYYVMSPIIFFCSIIYNFQQNSALGVLATLICFLNLIIYKFGNRQFLGYNLIFLLLLVSLLFIKSCLVSLHMTFGIPDYSFLIPN